jgi:hypothetical protein
MEGPDRDWAIIGCWNLPRSGLVQRPRSEAGRSLMEKEAFPAPVFCIWMLDLGKIGIRVVSRNMDKSLWSYSRRS